MAVTDLKIESFANPVATMPDRPAMEGWSVQRIKERFDSNAEALRQSLNGLIDHVDENDSANKTAIENKVDKEDGKGLSANSYTDEDMALVKTVSGKADKTNVIEKNSTSPFTPTEDTHPANKGYVDKVVNEKLKEVGAGDMSQEVYDPQGKKLDIFAEIANYLPLTGGTLSGNVAVSDADNSFPMVFLGGNVEGENGYVAYSGGNKAVDLAVSGGGSNVILNIGAGNTLANKVQVAVDDVNWYRIFGEHNKPIGSYNGNGSATSRTVNTGGLGNVLHISSNKGTVIANNAGGFAISIGGAASVIGYNQCHFLNGVLTIATNNAMVNENGQRYGYQVL